jgi:hypothetical protein
VTPSPKETIFDHVNNEKRNAEDPEANNSAVKPDPTVISFIEHYIAWWNDKPIGISPRPLPIFELIDEDLGHHSGQPAEKAREVDKKRSLAFVCPWPWLPEYFWLVPFNTSDSALAKTTFGVPSGFGARKPTMT